MSTTVSFDDLLEQALALGSADRLNLAMQLLESLREPLGAKPKRKRKAKPAADDGEESKPKVANNWQVLLSKVRTALKDVSGYKPKHAMKVGAYIKGKYDLDSITDEIIVDSFHSWLQENPDESASTSSGGSKVAPKAAAAAKATPAVVEAKREAIAAAAGGGGAAAPAETPVKKSKKTSDEAPAEKPKKAKKSKDDDKYNAPGGAEFTHDGVTYLRIKNHLFDSETNEFVGAWDAKSKTIDEEAEAPVVDEE